VDSPSSEALFFVRSSTQIPSRAPQHTFGSVQTDSKCCSRRRISHLVARSAAALEGKGSHLRSLPDDHELTAGPAGERCLGLSQPLGMVADDDHPLVQIGHRDGPQGLSRQSVALAVHARTNTPACCLDKAAAQRDLGLHIILQAAPYPTCASQQTARSVPNG
jgi:hypothetical protein